MGFPLVSPEIITVTTLATASSVTPAPPSYRLRQTRWDALSLAARFDIGPSAFDRESKTEVNVLYVLFMASPVEKLSIKNVNNKILSRDLMPILHSPAIPSHLWASTV